MDVLFDLVEVAAAAGFVEGEDLGGALVDKFFGDDAFLVVDAGFDPVFVDRERAWRGPSQKGIEIMPSIVRQRKVFLLGSTFRLKRMNFFIGPPNFFE